MRNFLENKMVLGGQAIEYTLRKSKRARRLRLAVYCDGSVVVTSPYDLQETVAERFLKEKMQWLLSKLNYFKQFKGQGIAKYSHEDYVKHRDAALAVVREKVTELSKIYGYRYNSINIKHQKTRWGSCSKKGNLNFNYKILFLPEHIQNYIVAHELCHLQEFNHSQRFWNLVARVIPDHAAIRAELRKHGLMHN